MTKDESEVVWLFNFGLESESGKPVSADVPEALLTYISEWAEVRGLQIGGGYRKPKPEDLAPGPIFDVDIED